MRPMGDQIGVYGVSWPEVIRQFIMVGGLAGLLLAILGMSDINTAPFDVLAVAIWVGLLLYMVVRLSRQPEIVLYEYGVALRDNLNDERAWRWEQITRWDGQRSTHSYEGIPIVRYGANHFYSGDERLFSVGVFRDRADQLANFIFSKLAQVNGLPRDYTRYQGGHTIQFDGVAMNKTGLGGNKQTARWDEIESMDFKNDHLRVKRYTDKKLRKFGYVSPVASYSLMSLLDRVRGTEFLPKKQAELLRSRGQIWFGHAKQLALVTLIVTVPLVGVIAFLSDGDQQGKQRHAGLIELTAQFGDVSTACESRSSGGYYSQPDDNRLKYLVIDNDDHDNPQIHKPLQAALLDSERATSADDVTTVVCLWTVPSTLSNCPYGDVIRRRYRQDYVLSVIDIPTGSVVLEDVLPGSSPARCPKTQDPGADLYGAVPSEGDFMDWLHQSSLLPPPLPSSGGQV